VVPALVVVEVLLLLSWARNSASMSSKSSAGRARLLALPLAGIIVTRVTLFNGIANKISRGRILCYGGTQLET
jgi:hypothetical protein